MDLVERLKLIGKMKIKVNHQKYFSPSGCVYQRGFKIDYKILENFMFYLQDRISKTKDYNEKIYLKSKFEIIESKFRN